MVEIYRKILDVHGVIMEFGVRWGRNLALFESLRGIHEPFNHNRKIVQYYDPETDHGIEHHQMDFANAVSKHMPQSVAEIQSSETKTPGTEIKVGA